MLWRRATTSSALGSQGRGADQKVETSSHFQGQASPWFARIMTQLRSWRSRSPQIRLFRTNQTRRYFASCENAATPSKKPWIFRNNAAMNKWKGWRSLETTPLLSVTIFPITMTTTTANQLRKILDQGVSSIKPMEGPSSREDSNLLTHNMPILFTTNTRGRFELTKTTLLLTKNNKTTKKGNNDNHQPVCII